MNLTNEQITEFYNKIKNMTVEELITQMNNAEPSGLGATMTEELSDLAEAVIAFDGQWPYSENEMYLTQHIHTPIPVSSDSVYLCNRDEFEAEVERLVNKPSWDDAPEWAEWLGQDSYCPVWKWLAGGVYSNYFDVDTGSGYWEADREERVNHDCYSFSNFEHTLERRP